MSTELDPLLKRLNLANTRRVWRDLVTRAEQEDWSYEQFLQTMLAEEVAHRRGTRLQRAVRAANFPFLRTVEEFDFTYQSTLRLTTMGSLLSPDFVLGGHAVIFEGKPGRGKTHLAIAVAYRALQNGFEARFTTAAALIDELSSASRAGTLREAVAGYVKPHVLLVDEVGYLTYGTDAANVLFHVVNERHIRKRAMLFTSKPPQSRCSSPRSSRSASGVASSPAGEVWGQRARAMGNSQPKRALQNSFAVTSTASSHALCSA